MTSDVTVDGLVGTRPGRQAVTGGRDDRLPRRSRGEERQVPPADFRSYYGQPIIRGPQWEALDIAGYLFLGGLAGGSALLALAADVGSDDSTATRAKMAAAGSAALSLPALVHDLCRPERFVNMLRVVKPTSAMNMGSWLLAAFAPATFVSAASAATGRMPAIGRLATGVAGGLGPPVASYTAVLLSDTAVPAWHDGADEMPFAFVGSSAMATGGMAMLMSPGETGGPSALGVIGAATELAALERMRHRLGVTAEAYERGPQRTLLRAGRALAIGGAVATVFARQRPLLRRAAGALLVTASVLTRFGIFRAGQDSADNPRFTVEPQRRRLERRKRLSG